jgi:hypothetical protein
MALDIHVDFLLLKSPKKRAPKIPVRVTAKSRFRDMSLDGPVDDELIKKQHFILNATID